MGMTIAEKIIAAAAGVDSVKGVLRYRQTRWKMPQTLGFRYTGTAHGGFPGALLKYRAAQRAVPRIGKGQQRFQSRSPTVQPIQRYTFSLFHLRFSAGVTASRSR